MPLFCCKLFPTLSPKNCCFWEKSEFSWEKSGHYWEKSHVSWENGNLVKNIVHAPTRPEGAEAPSPGHSPWVNQQSTLRPVRAKAFKIQTLKAHPSQFHEEDAFNKFNHSYQNILSPKRELNSCLRVFERLQFAKA